MIVKNVWGTPINFDTAYEYMDKELREELHREIAPCTNQEFFNEYCRQHIIRFKETWELDKRNPVY